MEPNLDSSDELAQELDAAPWDTVIVVHRRPRREATIAETAVFASPELGDVIAAFIESRYLVEFAAVCHSCDDAAQRALRRRARELLCERVTAPLALEIEALIFVRCGARAGPGAYNSKIRQLVLNLKNNAALLARVESSAITPTALVTMRSEDLRTAAAQQRAAHWKRAAEEAAVRRPAPAHVVGAHVCVECGSSRQWLRRRVRPSDITMYSEFLVCVDCWAIVPPVICTVQSLSVKD
jgi:hypothetical protein